MREKLIQAGLLGLDEKMESGPDILTAWKILSRLGHPGRYGGRSQDGLHEYLIVNSKTGSLLASGKGSTVEAAMCEASIAARAPEGKLPG